MDDETARLWGLPRRHDQPVPVVGPLGYYPRRLGTLVRYEAGAPQPPVYLVWQEERALAGDFGPLEESAVCLRAARVLEPKSYRMTHQRAAAASRLVGLTAWLLFWLRMGDRPWCDGIETQPSDLVSLALSLPSAPWGTLGSGGFDVALRVVDGGQVRGVAASSASSPLDAVGRAISHAVRRFKEPGLRCDAFAWLPLELRRLERRGYL